MDDKPLAVFPFVPDAITRHSFRPFEYGDFPTEEDVKELLYMLWLEPDTAFYYYHEKDQPLEPTLLAAVRTGFLRADHSERRHYRHPNDRKDYVRIEGPDEQLEQLPFEWQKEVVAAGPEYWRSTLTLSPYAKNDFDTQHKIDLEERLRQQRQRSRYTFDAFLSYSAANSAEAEIVHAAATAAGLRVFMAPKLLQPGDDFAEEIRASLEGSAELWLLLSPQSAKSEWVTSEWGAAWVLKRRIVPILHRCEPSALPDRLAKFHCVDLHRLAELIDSRVARPSEKGV